MVSVLDSVGCSVEVSSEVVSPTIFVVVSVSTSVEVGCSVAFVVVSSTSVVDWSVVVSSGTSSVSPPSSCGVESTVCNSAGGAPWNWGYVSASSPSCGGFGLSPFTTSRKESDKGSD